VRVLRISGEWCDRLRKGSVKDRGDEVDGEAAGAGSETVWSLSKGVISYLYEDSVLYRWTTQHSDRVSEWQEMKSELGLYKYRPSWVIVSTLWDELAGPIRFWCVQLFHCVSRRPREMYIGHACLSVCLSSAACPHYCTHPDVTWENDMIGHAL